MNSGMEPIYSSLQGIVERRGERLAVLDRTGLADRIDGLVREAIFNRDKVSRGHARWIIKNSAISIGAVPSSIHGLYDAMGRGEVEGFTVPAINIRGITYDVARAVFRAATKGRVGAFIFEIARSEMGYTDQTPSEYTTAILAAAIKEGFTGPVFIQGDHYQIKRTPFLEDREREMEAIKGLIRDSIASCFYNIDIDASTLVDIDRDGLIEQQRKNFEVTAHLTEFIRRIEPEGITVSVGGEIGEIGGRNSTPEELRAFMDGYLSCLKDGTEGLIKVSVQTGTTHGGVVLPDGSVAKVELDFETLESLSSIARKEYGLAGVVQHGASTLPDEAFHLFPEKGAAELHLATAFQNIIYDHPAFPGDLREEIYAYLKERFQGEWKEGETEEQFIYKTRKKAFGPFKRRLWDLSQTIRDDIGRDLESRFFFLFERLRVFDTVKVVEETVRTVECHSDLKREVEMA